MYQTNNLCRKLDGLPAPCFFHTPVYSRAKSACLDFALFSLHAIVKS